MFIKLTAWRSNHSLAHLLERTTRFKCQRKSFALFVGLFPLAIAFELLLLCTSSGNGISFCTIVFVSCTIRQTTHHPVFLAAGGIFGFCISNEEFQSCLLTPFKDVILVVKPYIILYVFIFDRLYRSRILSSI